MRASGTYTVKAFVPTDQQPDLGVATGLPVTIATMEKQFEGEIAGRSATLFTSAFDQSAGIGTYLAMESFEGTVAGRSGALNFAHSASTTGARPSAEYFVIVPGSGTGELAGITGVGGMTIDEDGTHRIWFEFELG